MNFNQIMRYARMLGLHKDLGRSIDVGVKKVVSRGNADADMTPEEREQTKHAREMAKRAQKLGPYRAACRSDVAALTRFSSCGSARPDGPAP